MPEDGVFRRSPGAVQLHLLFALVVEHGQQDFRQGGLLFLFGLLAFDGGLGFQIQQDTKEGDFAVQQPLDEGRRNFRPLAFDCLEQFAGYQPVGERDAGILLGTGGAGGLVVFVFIVHGGGS